MVSEQKGMSVDAIRKAFSTTEEEFLSLVRKQWKKTPQLASVGSCCLIGVVIAGTLYVANLGDSRSVLGRSDSAAERGIAAVAMTTDHNASDEAVRNELRSLHPNDPQIVVLKHNVWRVKGLIQVLFRVIIQSKIAFLEQISLQNVSLVVLNFLCFFYEDIEIYRGRLFERFAVQSRASAGQISSSSAVRWIDSQRRSVYSNA